MKELTIFIEEFNNFSEKYREIFQEDIRPLIKINNIPTQNIIDELLVNYNTNSLKKYTEFIILPKSEQIKEKNLLAFAENIHGNFYFVFDTKNREISCIDFDGDFLWNAANSLEEIFSIMTVYLKLRIERMYSEEGDVTDDSKKNYLNEMKKISGNEKYEEFYKYLCAIV